MKTKIRGGFCIIAIFLLAGCFPLKVQLYENPSGKTAVIRVSGNIYADVDGRNIPQSSFWNSRNRVIKLPPGQHRVRAAVKKIKLYL